MGKVQSYGDQSVAEWLKGKRCAPIVTLMAPQTPEVVASKVAQSTVLLNLAQRQPLSVPAKTYEQLASGREVLLLCEDDCESAQLVKGIQGVTQVDPANSRALAEVLFGLYVRHVINHRLTAPSEEQVSGFSREATNLTFYKVLSSLIDGQSPHGDAGRISH